MEDFKPLHIAGYAVAALFAAVLLNVTRQIFFRKTNEPPVVFHWFPFIGSTVTYGMNPLKFFQECREKVRSSSRLYKKFG